MNDLYKKKICIVTGAASGIGKAVSQALMEKGAIVIAVDINDASLKQWTSSYNDTTLSIDTLDVSDYLAFQCLVDNTVVKYGQLDYLFNIAGISIAGEAVDLEIEHWRKVLAIDLDGVVNGSTLAYKTMAKQKSGHIVNLASIQGLVPLPLEAPYVTAKFGVVGLSQALRIEGKELGVKVSVVCPGYVRTAIFSDSEMINLDRDKHLKSLDSFEKYGISPEECAQQILREVARNKAIIPLTTPAKILWWISRLSPRLLFRTLQKDLIKTRKSR